MCGENNNLVRDTLFEWGSPPRVRGKLYGVNQESKNIRITPACAGKTLIKIMKEGAVKDHPRVCGENVEKLATNPLPQGSPPRVRGKLNFCGCFVILPRITPACAGKTPRLSHYPFSARDHPRVCGENVVAPPIFGYIIGSPPRVRGKQSLVYDFGYAIRITPACAGKTSWRSKSSSQR